MGDNLRYYRPAILYALALTLLVGLAVGTARLTRPPAPPSVVLITVDSLRADHLGVYGYARGTSPNIDAWAREGVVFDNAFTVDTLSGPSHASLFTSLYSATHGVVYNGYELDGAARTLAEILRDAGYRTAAFVSDRLLGREFGFAQGFDRFEKSQVSGYTAGPAASVREGRSYQLARYWLKAQRGERFFLWLHCQQPHFSYDPPPPYDRMFDPDIPGDWVYRHFETMRQAHAEGRLTPEDERRVVALYDGEIALTDALLQPIFAELRQHPEPLLIVLTADHGDLLFEPGAPGHVGHGNGRFYDGALRVPLIVRLPAGLERGAERVGALVSSLDLLPTVAGFAGLPAPPGIEGRSLSGLLDGSATSVRDEVHALYLKDAERPVLAWRTSEVKLIHRAGASSRTELYDLADDPAESRDRAGARPEQVARLTERLLAWLDERPARFPGARDGLSPELREMLRRGGYLDEDDD